MRALDLFCGGGGASKGLADAGFEVTGVDREFRPRYPFKFIRADAMEMGDELAGYDLVWASPPCQAYSVASRNRGRNYPDLVAATRAMLSNHPFTVMENTPGAPLNVTLVLTGDMFGLKTYRRRHFECSFLVLAPAPGRPFGPKTDPESFTAAGHGCDGVNKPRLWAREMGVPWLVNRKEIAQVVPPVYAEFIGREAVKYFTAPEVENCYG